MWHLVVLSLLAVHYADGRKATTPYSARPPTKRTTVTTEKQLTVHDLIPSVPDNPPPPLRYYCEHLRPYIQKTTIYRKGQCPYSVEADWASDYTVAIYVLMVPGPALIFGFQQQMAFQVRIHDTRPIGWFHNNTDGVIAGCPPGRQNTMYLYNRKMSHHHTAVWHKPKWFQNETAKIFYMIMGPDLRYWRGNLTLSPR